MKIDIYHDTACPWCRIGKANLRTALNKWDKSPILVQYHPFFLNPNIPPDGHSFREYMQAKGGGQVPLEQWFSAPRQAGKNAGLSFNFEKIEVAPNTALSHQLIAISPEENREAVIDAIYAAYFEDGRNIGDIDELVNIAANCGLEPEIIRQKLHDRDQRDSIARDAMRGQRLGVTGVPFFIIDQRVAFSGAHPPDVILNILNQVYVEAQKE